MRSAGWGLGSSKERLGRGRLEKEERLERRIEGKIERVASGGGGDVELEVILLGGTGNDYD